MKRTSPHVLLVDIPPREADRIAQVLAELGVPSFAMDGGEDIEPLVVGSLRVDPVGRTAHLDGRELRLTAKEFGVLLFLARNAGAFVSRREFLAEVWNRADAGAGRTVDIHIRRIRSKLGQRENAIETKVHVGYRLVPERLLRPAADGAAGGEPG